jgi:phosphatidylglycerol:prolipoprotein diacylglycerol transferase
MIELTFDPILWRPGFIELSWHGLFTALAVILAVWYGLRRARAMGFPEQPLTDVAIGLVLGGMIGARLFFVLDHIDHYVSSPVDALRIWEGGIAVYGAFIGGIAGGYLAARRAGLPAWPLLDAAAPAMLIGQAVGRLGCLSNGDAWGEPTGGSWGLVYMHPDAAVPGELIGVAMHPYPVYEMAGVGILFAVLWLGRRWLAPTGRLFLVTALGYAAIRFCLSFFRQETEILWNLQQAHLIALATALTALVLLARPLIPTAKSRLRNLLGMT